MLPSSDTKVLQQLSADTWTSHLQLSVQSDSEDRKLIYTMKESQNFLHFTVSLTAEWESCCIFNYERYCEHKRNILVSFWYQKLHFNFSCAPVSNKYYICYKCLNDGGSNQTQFMCSCSNNQYGPKSVRKVWALCWICAMELWDSSEGKLRPDQYQQSVPNKVASECVQCIKASVTNDESQ